MKTRNDKASLFRRRKSALTRREEDIKNWKNHLASHDDEWLKKLLPEKLTKEYIKAKINLASTEVETLKKRVSISV